MLYLVIKFICPNVHHHTHVLVELHPGTPGGLLQQIKGLFWPVDHRTVGSCCCKRALGTRLDRERGRTRRGMLSKVFTPTFWLLDFLLQASDEKARRE